MQISSIKSKVSQERGNKDPHSGEGESGNNRLAETFSSQTKLQEPNEGEQEKRKDVVINPTRSNYNPTATKKTRRHHTSNSLPLSFVVFHLKFFGALSVFAVILWFHIRLTALEAEVMNRAVQEGERNGYTPSKENSTNKVGNDGEIVFSTVHRLGGHKSGADAKMRVKRRVSKRDRGRSNYNVEFINPKARDEVERSGGAQGHSSTPGSEANTVPEDDWVWLTSYSRIPV